MNEAIRQSTYERRKAAILARIHISDYIRRYAWEVFGNQRKPVMRTRADADYYKKMFSNPIGSPIRSLLHISSGNLYKYSQDVDYICSNLGSGFVFYFLCVWCGRRTKYLYVDQSLEALLCRKCIKFPYPQPTRPERKASRYLRRHPEVIQQLINSGKIPAY